MRNLWVYARSLQLDIWECCGLEQKGAPTFLQEPLPGGISVMSFQGLSGGHPPLKLHQSGSCDFLLGDVMRVPHSCSWNVVAAPPGGWEVTETAGAGPATRGHRSLSEHPDLLMHIKAHVSLKPSSDATKGRPAMACPSARTHKHRLHHHHLRMSDGRCSSLAGGLTWVSASSPRLLRVSGAATPQRMRTPTTPARHGLSPYGLWELETLRERRGGRRDPRPQTPPGMQRDRLFKKAAGDSSERILRRSAQARLGGATRRRPRGRGKTSSARQLARGFSVAFRGVAWAPEAPNLGASGRTLGPPKTGGVGSAGTWGQQRGLRRGPQCRARGCPWTRQTALPPALSFQLERKVRKGKSSDECIAGRILSSMVLGAGTSCPQPCRAPDVAPTDYGLVVLRERETFCAVQVQEVWSPCSRRRGNKSDQQHIWCWLVLTGAGRRGMGESQRA